MKYKIGDYVILDDGSLFHINSIPDNLGCRDYGGNFIMTENWGDIMTGCFGINEENMLNIIAKEDVNKVKEEIYSKYVNKPKGE